MDIFGSLMVKLGYALAIYLWRPLGVRYYGPMVVVLVVSIVVFAWKYLHLPWDTVLTPTIMVGYHVLLLFWVVNLSRIFKDNVGYPFAVTALIVLTMQMSVIRHLDTADPRYYINLTSEMMGVLEAAIAILILFIFLWWTFKADYRKGVLKKLREGRRLMILDKASRVLIPLFAWSMLNQLSNLFHDSIPAGLNAVIGKIATLLLAWGWVILHYRSAWERAEINEELSEESAALSDKLKDVARKGNGFPK